MQRLFTAILASLAAKTAHALTCKNDQGSSVDTWAILKAPQGSRYLYADPDTPFAPSAHPSLNTTTVGALATTLQQLWKSADSYVLYNDEPPNSGSYDYNAGHTKGALLLADDGSAIWLQHSIPNFPLGLNDTSKYLGLPGSAWTYGQHLYCMTITGTTADTLAYTFLLNRPNIYDSALSSAARTQYPNLTKLVDGDYSTAAICGSHEIQTAAGQSHILFGKTTQWNQDLWEDCVAPKLAADLDVESWIRGSAIGPSCSGAYHTLDVNAVNYAIGFVWNETDDHSKWATSTDGDWVCFGDINRMTTQYKRGGGTVCLEGSALGKFISESITNTDLCWPVPW